MPFREEQAGDLLIVSPQGHLDTALSEPFERRLGELLESGARRVLIDCSALSYVNSAGLKILLLAAKRFESAGGRLVLCSLTPSVAVVFQTIGFDRILQVAASRKEGFQLLDSAILEPGG